MVARTSGFTPTRSVRSRCYDGIVVDLWTVDCAASSRGWYQSPDPRLFVALQATCGGFELSVAGEGTAMHSREPSFSYVPAMSGAEARTARAGRLVHLDIHVSEAALAQRFGDAVDPVRLRTPVLADRDPAIIALAELLAVECSAETASANAHGDGLVEALLAHLLGIGDGAADRSGPGLDRRTLRTVIAYMERHALRAVGLAELAERAAMSGSRFGQAFRVSTGISPMRWHMKIRIANIQRLLLDDTMTLTELADHAGFADQAHLTRSFRSVVGMPPRRWLRSVRSIGA